MAGGGAMSEIIALSIAVIALAASNVLLTIRLSRTERSVRLLGGAVTHLLANHVTHAVALRVPEGVDVDMLAQDITNRLREQSERGR